MPFFKVQAMTKYTLLVLQGPLMFVLDIGACEKILSDKTAENFEDCLHVEQCE